MHVFPFTFKILLKLYTYVVLKKKPNKQTVSREEETLIVISELDLSVATYNSKRDASVVH